MVRIGTVITIVWAATIGTVTCPAPVGATTLIADWSTSVHDPNFTYYEPSGTSITQPGNGTATLNVTTTTSFASIADGHSISGDFVASVHVNRTNQNPLAWGGLYVYFGGGYADSLTFYGLSTTEAVRYNTLTGVHLDSAVISDGTQSALSGTFKISRIGSRLSFDYRADTALSWDTAFFVDSTFGSMPVNVDISAATGDGATSITFDAFSITSSVPEPSCAGLLSTGLFLCLCARARTRWRHALR